MRRRRILRLFLTFLVLSWPFFLLAGCRTDDKRVPLLEEKVRKLEAQLRQLKTEQMLAPAVSATAAPAGKSADPANRSQAVSDAEMTLSGNERDDPFLGNGSSDLLLMAFYDYESEASRRFAKNTLQALRQDVIPVAGIKFVLRDFPLPNHPDAVAAASLAQCAGEQGKYWQAFDLLNSRDLPFDFSAPSTLSAAGAAIPGIDKVRLERCLRSGRYTAEIEKDVLDGQTLGARGAPSFFLGRCAAGTCRGKFIRGAQPFGLFKRLLTELSSVDTAKSP